MAPGVPFAFRVRACNPSACSACPAGASCGMNFTVNARPVLLGLFPAVARVGRPARVEISVQFASAAALVNATLAIAGLPPSAAPPAALVDADSEGDTGSAALVLGPNATAVAGTLGVQVGFADGAVLDFTLEVVPDGINRLVSVVPSEGDKEGGARVVVRVDSLSENFYRDVRVSFGGHACGACVESVAAVPGTDLAEIVMRAPAFHTPALFFDTSAVTTAVTVAGGPVDLTFDFRYTKRCDYAAYCPLLGASFVADAELLGDQNPTEVTCVPDFCLDTDLVAEPALLYQSRGTGPASGGSSVSFVLRGLRVQTAAQLAAELEETGEALAVEGFAMIGRDVTLQVTTPAVHCPFETCEMHVLLRSSALAARNRTLLAVRTPFVYENTTYFRDAPVILSVLPGCISPSSPACDLSSVAANAHGVAVTLELAALSAFDKGSGLSVFDGAGRTVRAEEIFRAHNAAASRKFRLFFDTGMPGTRVFSVFLSQTEDGHEEITPPANFTVRVLDAQRPVLSAVFPSEVPAGAPAFLAALLRNAGDLGAAAVADPPRVRLRAAGGAAVEVHDIVAIPRPHGEVLLRFTVPALPPPAGARTSYTLLVQFFGSGELAFPDQIVAVPGGARLARLQPPGAREGDAVELVLDGLDAHAAYPPGALAVQFGAILVPAEIVSQHATGMSLRVVAPRSAPGTVLLAVLDHRAEESGAGGAALASAVFEFLRPAPAPDPASAPSAGGFSIAVTVASWVDAGEYALEEMRHEEGYALPVEGASSALVAITPDGSRVRLKLPPVARPGRVTCTLLEGRSGERFSFDVALFDPPELGEVRPSALENVPGAPVSVRLDKFPQVAEAADVEARICGVSATVARVLGPDTLSLLLPEGVLVGECAVEVLPARLRASPLAGAMTARAALEVLEPRPKITLLRPKLLGAAGGSTVTVFGAFFPPVFAKASVDVRLGDRPAYVQDLVVSDARDTVLIVQLPPSDELGAATLRVTVGGIAVSAAVLVSDLRASLACRPVQTAVSFGPALAGAAVRVFSAPAPGCEDPAQPCASLLLETTAGAAPLLLTAGRYIFEFSGARGARLTVAQGVHGPALLLNLALPASAGAGPRGGGRCRRTAARARRRRCGARSRRNSGRVRRARRARRARTSRGQRS
jgi:hypothetical protein